MQCPGLGSAKNQESDDGKRERTKARDGHLGYGTPERIGGGGDDVVTISSMSSFRRQLLRLGDQGVQILWWWLMFPLPSSANARPLQLPSGE